MHYIRYYGGSLGGKIDTESLDGWHYTNDYVGKLTRNTPTQIVTPLNEIYIRTEIRHGNYSTYEVCYHYIPEVNKFLKKEPLTQEEQKVVGDYISDYFLNNTL